MSFRNAKGGYIRPGYDPLEVANPPTGAGATAGNTTASVSFTAPSNTGGGAITNYYAVSNPGQITASSVTSPISVSGLTNGTEYTFKVWGENSYGPSAYSAPTGAVTPAVPPYVEDVFSTYLYTGNGSTQTITNGIDLSGEGGLVWLKSRSLSAVHTLVDTVRGANKTLFSDLTNGEETNSAVTAFNSDGFTMGSYNNSSSGTYASWTFRQAEKFFDVVTWTGNGASERAINHNLGSVPGFVVVKCTSTSGDWWVAARNNSGTYHRSDNSSGTGRLNTTGPLSSALNLAGLGYLTSTTFIPQGVTGGVLSESNTNGATYVAYLFAHDAGGFGDSANENVISCGTFSTGASGKMSAPVNLGYEVQWLLVKNVNSTENWQIYDNMRGMSFNGYNVLYPNLSNAEYVGTSVLAPTATGFDTPNANGPFASSATYIYIAIRRGPMKTPTTGTSVFSPVVQLADQFVTTNFPVDSMWSVWTTLAGYGSNVADRLRGGGNYLNTRSTAAEDVNATQYIKFDYNNGVDESLFNPSFQRIYWNFRRAPGFFDVVCYTGTGSATTFSHNLGVAPELMIVKSRGLNNWAVYSASSGATKVQYLDNTTEAFVSSVFWNDTSPTSSVFTVGTSSRTNESSINYVAYLFASVTGVSKVGSYTGTGTTLQVNCGFTGGARFVLIKRTDSTGDWYVWDSARGIVAGNDPYVLLNNDAAEVTNTDYVDTYSAGFEISSTAPAAINANGGTYIFLAIA